MLNIILKSYLPILIMQKHLAIQEQMLSIQLRSFCWDQGLPSTVQLQTFHVLVQQHVFT